MEQVLNKWCYYFLFLKTNQRARSLENCAVMETMGV